MKAWTSLMKASSILQPRATSRESKASSAFCSLPIRLVLVPFGRLKLCNSEIRFAVWAEGPLTVTAKLPADELPAASVAVQRTVFMPIGKVLPEEGAQAKAGARPELSAAV